jgi:hypothetical protein
MCLGYIPGQPCSSYQPADWQSGLNNDLKYVDMLLIQGSRDCLSQTSRSCCVACGLAGTGVPLMRVR